MPGSAAGGQEKVSTLLSTMNAVLFKVSICIILLSRISAVALLCCFNCSALSSQAPWCHKSAFDVSPPGLATLT